MEKTVKGVNLQHLYKTLKTLGYYLVKTGEAGEWRKGNFHLYVYPLGKKGVKLSLHKDFWEKPPPIFEHKTINKGEDINQELQRIEQTCKEYYKIL